jgi:hypothetical protein
MSIKATWVVGEVQTDESVDIKFDGKEFHIEKDAVAAAKKWLSEERGDDDQICIFRLSHVLTHEGYASPKIKIEKLK